MILFRRKFKFCNSIFRNQRIDIQIIYPFKLLQMHPCVRLPCFVNHRNPTRSSWELGDKADFLSNLPVFITIWTRYDQRAGLSNQLEVHDVKVNQYGSAESFNKDFVTVYCTETKTRMSTFLKCRKFCWKRGRGRIKWRASFDSRNVTWFWPV